jgi:hypothetical protein
MFRSLIRGAAPLLLLLSAPIAAQPVMPADMMRHIETLASDDFEGRKPGSEGEAKTVAYIAAQLAARGYAPAGPDGSWYQDVPLMERRATAHRAAFRAGGRAVPFDPADLVLIGAEPRVAVEGAPVWFAGHGVVDPARGIDQTGGADFRGAAVLILLDGPDVADFPSMAARVRMMQAKGAAAVIGIVGPDIPWPAVQRSYRAGSTRLDSAPPPALQGGIRLAAAEALFRAGGRELSAILDGAAGPAFRAVPLGLAADLSAETEVRQYVSRNVIGRLPGSGGTGESLLYLAHWDHFGICRPEGAPNRICNGAVDNASGVAMMIEIAGRLAAGERPQRDVLILATTAEEMGLLGAEHFAAHQVVPAESIVAAINLDTVAIHRAGAPVAVIGRGIAELDAAIAETAAEAGRAMDTSFAADGFVQRQDGWALARAGIPAVMVGGSFADMAALQSFLSGHYHQPEDELGRDFPLDGAAEDADLLVALGRRLADPARYQRPQRWQRP